jgi:RNA polymerase sigma-70 factor (ECF subfamily)
MTADEAVPQSCGMAGKHAEFEQLVARTRRQAYNKAYRMTGNREDAEDLIQEAYLRAYRSFDRYDRAFPFEGWLFRILSNLFVDGLRRKFPQTLLSLNQAFTCDDGRELLLEVPDENSNPEALVMKGVLVERLQKALAALPQEFRTVILLCDVEGISYREVARAMGIRMGTVRSRIYRGRLKLRRLMDSLPDPAIA